MRVLGGGRRPGRRGRGSVGPGVPGDDRGRRPALDRHPGRRRRARRRPARRVDARRRRRHGRPPVPDRRGALGRSGGRPSSTGRSDAAPTIVEDDYDAEFRYDRQPIGALQGLRPDRVVYAGSASKVLAPGPAARLARRARSALVEPITAAKEAADMGSAAFDQLALADLARARRARPSPPPDAADLPRPPRRAARRAWPGTCPISGRPAISAGLHVLAWLPPDLEAERGPDRRGGGRRGDRRRRARDPAASPRARRAALRLRGDRRGPDRRRGSGRSRRCIDGSAEPETEPDAARSTGRRRLRHPAPRRAEPPRSSGPRELLGTGTIRGRPLGAATRRRSGRTATRPSSPARPGRSSLSCTGWRDPAHLGRIWTSWRRTTPPTRRGSEYLRRRVSVHGRAGRRRRGPTARRRRCRPTPSRCRVATGSRRAPRIRADR